nr:MAG TPA: hypothetical protein [Caudoviricetes sp.]
MRQRLVRAVDLHDLDELVAGRHFDFQRRRRQLCPGSLRDRRALRRAEQRTLRRGGVVVPLRAVAVMLAGDQGNGALAGRRTDRLHGQLLQLAAALIVDTADLLVEDEAVIDEPPLAQPAGDSGRVVMGLELFELLRRSRRQRMAEDERAAGRKTGGRNLHDLRAVHLADHALDEHLLRSVAVLHERAVLLEQVGERIRAERHAALIRNVVVAERFHALQEQLVGVALGRRSRIAVAGLDGRIREGLKAICVELGDHDLIGLSRKGLAGIHDHLALDLVALVDDERERAVSLDRHRLHVSLEVVRRAVAVRTAAGVVLQRNDRDRVDLDGLHAGELIVVVQGHHGLRLFGESFVHLVAVLGCKVFPACHKIIPFCLWRSAKSPRIGIKSFEERIFRFRIRRCAASDALDGCFCRCCRILFQNIVLFLELLVFGFFLPGFVLVVGVQQILSAPPRLNDLHRELLCLQVWPGYNQLLRLVLNAPVMMFRCRVLLRFLLRCFRCSFRRFRCPALHHSVHIVLGNALRRALLRELLHLRGLVALGGLLDHFIHRRIAHALRHLDILLHLLVHGVISGFPAFPGLCQLIEGRHLVFANVHVHVFMVHFGLEAKSARCRFFGLSGWCRRFRFLRLVVFFGLLCGGSIRLCVFRFGLLFWFVRRVRVPSRPFVRKEIIPGAVAVRHHRFIFFRHRNHFIFFHISFSFLRGGQNLWQHRRIGGKDPSKREDAIAQCCLISPRLWCGAAYFMLWAF